MAIPQGRAAGASDRPRVYEATRAGGPSGAVIKGSEIDFAAAVARRRTGRDIVVCGDDLIANRELAKAIEAGLGPYEQERFHRSAGPLALPHFHQRSRSPEGHAFYETEKRKARSKP